MKKERVKYCEYIISALWVLFFLFLLAQYRYVYLYYDDFGYCSLSYGYDAGIYGTNMRLSDIIKYLFHSYFQVNGRAFTNFLLVLMAWIGGMETMRIVLPICILVVYLLIYKLIKRPEMEFSQEIIITIFLCFSYGMFSLNVCHYGLYWFAAAYGYVVPMLLFLVFCIIYKSKRKVLPVIAFALCLSSEQMIAMTVAFIIFNSVLDLWERKRLDVIHVITFFSAIVSSIIMIGSPASRARMTSEGNAEFYNKPFFDKIFNNIDQIVKLFFNEIGVIFGIALLFSFLCLSVQLIKITSQFKLVHIIWGICTCLMIIAYLSKYCKFSPEIILIDKPKLLFLYFAFSFGEAFLFYFINDRDKAGWVLATMASLAILLVVPEIPVRTFIPFIFMCILLIADIMIKSGIIAKQKPAFILMVCIMIPYMLLSANNLKGIYSGYKKNSIVLDYNNCKLMEAKDKLESGEVVDTVELYKLIDASYAGQQAYDLSISYMKFWIDEYYALPYEVEYVYYDYPNGDNPVAICHVK